MKLSLNREKALSSAFVFLSMGSTLYISLSAMDYLQFYPALTRLQGQVTKVTSHRDNSSNVTSLSVFVTVSNPTSYSGFTPRYMVVSIDLVHKTQAYTAPILQQFSVGSEVAGTPLGPNSMVSSNVTTSLSADDASTLLASNKTFSGQIFVRTDITIEVETFLAPAIGRIPVESTQELPLLWN